MMTPTGDVEIASPLVGKPHVYNMLAASAAALELGYSLDTIAKGIGSCAGAPGRFERVPNDRGLAVIVDYAHTDDALENTLKTARPLTSGRVITVFGCGGDRDRSKRVPMGNAAAENSDIVIITSDNPRNEEPLKIIQEIEKGVTQHVTGYEVISDRREAIRRAISIANGDDVVIIAGKGHETYQIIGNDKYHFDDREVAAEAIAELEY
jgi:UDP-N-acetylmuramoyl-L-alanyl-D-glutamate--2,6-diaminopimelate ligase